MNNISYKSYKFLYFYSSSKLTLNWKFHAWLGWQFQKRFPLLNRRTFGEMYLSKVTWQFWYVFLLLLKWPIWNIQYKGKIALIYYYYYYFFTFLVYQRNVFHYKIKIKASLKSYQVFKLSMYIVLLLLLLYYHYCKV